MNAPVRWWCSRCDESLHLENTLWKSEDGDYRCDVGGYPTMGGGQTVYVERVAHAPSSSWVHPALRRAKNEEAA